MTRRRLAELPLFQANEARDEAIERAGAHAQPPWVVEARRALRAVAETRSAFTSDDVFEAMSPLAATHEPRAMGAVLKHGQQAGWCEPSDRFVNSKHARNHRRPQRIWLSRLGVSACV